MTSPDRPQIGGDAVGCAFDDDDDRRQHGRGSERLRERGDVLAALERLLRGERRYAAQGLLIEGSDGVGKTAVLNAGRVRAEHHGWSVLATTCRRSGTGVPFATARGLFGDRVDDELSSGGPDAVRRALTTMLNSMPGRGVLLIVDDARLADEQTWEWFLDLAASPPDMPLAVLASAAPRGAGAPVSTVDALATHPSTQVFRLHGLSEAAIGDLLRERLTSRTVSPRLVSAVARATRGNPLLVHRAADVLADLDGDLEQALDGDDWNLPSADVATWTLTRIHDLPADAVTMIRSVAILGDKADLRAVEAVARAFGGIADTRLLADQLAELDILVRSRELGFVHRFVELSVYAEISPILRTTAHLLAAQQLRLRQRPEAEVAAHLLHTEPADDESTVDALIDAAQRLLDAEGDARMAGRFVDRAIKEPPSSNQLPFVYSLRAEVMARTGVGDPVRALRNAFALSSDPVPMIRSALAVIEQQWDRPSATDVIRLLSTVTAVGGLRPSDRVVLALATALLDGGPAAGAVLDHELRALVEADEANTPPTAEGDLRVVAAVAAAVLRAADPGACRLDDVMATLTPDLPVARMLASPMQAHVFAQLTTLLVGSGELDAAADLLTSAREAGGGCPAARAWHSVLRAEIEVACGRLLEAERELYAVVSRRELEGSGSHDAAMALLGVLMELRGNTPYSFGVLPTRVGGVRRTSQAWQELKTLGAEAAVHAAHSDWKAARARFRLARELASVAQVGNPSLTGWRSGMAMALLAGGDVEPARRHALEELAAAVEFGAVLPQSRALRALAACTADPAESVSLLARALALVEDAPLLMERCLVMLDLGGSLRAVGQDEEARVTLRTAGDLAVRMGAGALMSSTHHELVAAGARPRRLAQTGVPALTPSERKVAGMAAAGMKNTEIAAELYISIKTVESHLARVYRKLHVSGRGELTGRGTGLDVIVASAESTEPTRGAR